MLSEILNRYKNKVFFHQFTRQNHTQDVLADEEMIGERVEYADLEYYLKDIRYLKEFIWQ